MPKILTTVLLALLALVLVLPVTAQEGYPLKGSWIGVWEGNSAGESVIVLMDWDGEKVSGIINPGTDNLEIEEATMDPSDWSVHIEAGNYTIEGTIEKIELPSRSVVGTWSSSAGGNGRFEITRQ